MQAFGNLDLEDIGGPGLEWSWVKQIQTRARARFDWRNFILFRVRLINGFVFEKRKYLLQV